MLSRVSFDDDFVPVRIGKSKAAGQLVVFNVGCAVFACLSNNSDEIRIFYDNRCRLGIRGAYSKCSCSKANRHSERQKHSHHFFHHKIVLLFVLHQEMGAMDLLFFVILIITSFFGLHIYTIRGYKFGQKPPTKKYFFSLSKKGTLYRIL